VGADITRCQVIIQAMEVRIDSHSLLFYPLFHSTKLLEAEQGGLAISQGIVLITFPLVSVIFRTRFKTLPGVI